MSSISVAHKVFLEEVLGMRTGYALDFSNASFASLFDDVGIDIYDREKYAGFGDSKAERLRALWKRGSDEEVSVAVGAIADYVEAKKAVDGLGDDITDEQIARMRLIVHQLHDSSARPPAPPMVPTLPVAITTEATVTNNQIQIEIHEDIYNHIGQYLATGDHFHAVEESYKLVREKLREITGEEKATNAFAADNYEKLFGHKSESPAEGDFFEGVKFLNMAIQFLRNEKAHTPATPMEPNLALHYISLASLAYDLITRYVSETTVTEIEDLLLAKRRSYGSASAFYRDFANGAWLRSLTTPASLASTSVRRALKKKWLEEADLTLSYDHSNVVFMRFEMIAQELTGADLDYILGLPTKDAHGNDQEAGTLPFLEFIEQDYPDRLSAKAKAWLKQQRESVQ